MKWLTTGEAENLLSGRKMEPQAFVLYCDASDLSGSLPIEPHRVPDDEGLPSPTNQWVGLVDDRPVVVQQELIPNGCRANTVTVLTPSGIGPERWTALRALQQLPWPIRPSRPYHIESGCASQDHVVCRPLANGWFDLVYRAPSSAEAEHLLTYLKSADPWNEACFVTEMGPLGKWIIVRQFEHEGQIVGGYPDVDSAVRVALNMSCKHPKDKFRVRDAATRQSKQYDVSHGRVSPV
jgi:hypothetical protein